MQQTIHIMRYLFPRQFGLHNVFTSRTDPRETAMPLKDYTLREKDVHQSMCKTLGEKALDIHAVERWKMHLPKRLRGEAVRLVDRLRVLHHRCSYTELLRHYCPVQASESLSCPERTAEDAPFTAMACQTAHVSAFCRAVVAKVVPHGLWGSDHNKHIIMHWIDQFIYLRKFETLTLHQVTQKLQVSWLQGANTNYS
jgi:telomerase reverse transcriptase